MPYFTVDPGFISFWGIVVRNPGGVPVLFHSTLFPELLALKTTEGAKTLIQKYYSQVLRIPFAQGVIDIDTLQDYEQLISPHSLKLKEL